LFLAKRCLPCYFSSYTLVLGELSCGMDCPAQQRCYCVRRISHHFARTGAQDTFSLCSHWHIRASSLASGRTSNQPPTSW
jgi:hypothetical protein